MIGGDISISSKSVHPDETLARETKIGLFHLRFKLASRQS